MGNLGGHIFGPSEIDQVLGLTRIPLTATEILCFSLVGWNDHVLLWLFLEGFSVAGKTFYFECKYTRVPPGSSLFIRLPKEFLGKHIEMTLRQREKAHPFVTTATATDIARHLNRHLKGPHRIRHNMHHAPVAISRVEQWDSIHGKNPTGGDRTPRTSVRHQDLSMPLTSHRHLRHVQTHWHMTSVHRFDNLIYSPRMLGVHVNAMSGPGFEVRQLWELQIFSRTSS